MSKANNVVEKMTEQLEERRVALVARSALSEDAAELRSIYEQIKEINKNLSELKQAALDDAVAMDERTQTVNGVETRGESLKFMQRAVSAPFGIFGELRAVTVGKLILVFGWMILFSCLPK